MKLKSNLIYCLSALLLAAITSNPLSAETRVEKNVIYGMYSGLALLMDVHYPENRMATELCWCLAAHGGAPLSLDAKPLKDHAVDEPSLGMELLLDKGYTIFPINHRAGPRFPYPAAVEDVQRAVRYIRHHADDFGITPTHIGAIGSSSGGYLVSMLGLLDGDSNTGGFNDIDKESSNVQAVVALYPATDLIQFAKDKGGSNALLSLFMGTYYGWGQSSAFQPEEAQLFVEASPVTYVHPMTHLFY